MKATKQARYNWNHLFALQLGRNWIDRTTRGHGNRAARRAILTRAGQDHLLWENEPTYTDRNWILSRGSLLLVLDQIDPHEPVFAAQRTRMNTVDSALP